MGRYDSMACNNPAIPAKRKEQTMSKYISEDILLEDLWDSKCESDILRRVRQAIVDEIIGIESIDIVRCGECKYWRAYETWSVCELWTGDPYEAATTKADDFCSYGEREGE